MTHMLRIGIRRPGETFQLKLQKFLELSHFLHDHVFYGPPVSHNSDTGERGLKHWAKKLAATAQSRGDDVFKSQVTQNLIEQEILEDICHAQCLEDGTPMSKPIPPSLHLRSSNPIPSGDNYVFVLQKLSGGHVATWVERKISGSKRVETSQVAFPEILAAWMSRRFSVSIPENCQARIQLHTELAIFGEERDSREIISW